MSTAFTLSAQVRTQHGTRHARRLRAQGRVPAIIYGAQKVEQMISLDHNKVSLAMAKSGFFSQILHLVVDEAPPLQVILKTHDKHCIKKQILHLDFQRIDAKEAMVISIPIKFIGEEDCAAIQDEDGVLNAAMTTLEIKCLPQNIPEHVEINVSSLAMDQTLHMSEVSLPDKVELTAKIDNEHNPLIASVHLPKVMAEEPEEVEEIILEGDEKADQATEETATTSDS
jgi:large subunit ribosomal protein L25